MAASLLQVCQKRTRKRLLSIAHSALFFYSDRFFGSRKISLYQYESEHYNKQFRRFLTYAAVLTSGLSYLFYNVQDERRNILCSVKEIIFPTVCAKEPTNVVFNRDKYNFIADVVEVSAPSVVYIEIKDQKRVDLFTGKPATASNGSGFIVKEDGLILTNAHVVINKPNTIVKVRLQDGTNYTGTVEDIDIQSDLATVRINKNNLPVMKLGNSAKLRPGEFVVAIGSPLSLSNTITSGVVSSVNRNSEELGLHHKHMDYIQTDAAITFGNSGGPLVNLDGEAIGINAMKVTAGISFAIPIDYAKEFLKKSEERKRNRGLNVSTGSKEYMRRRYLGITMLTLTPDIINDMAQSQGARYSLITHGVLIWKVMFGSPAYSGGLKPGDIITHVDREPIQSSNNIYKALETTGSLMLTVIRNGAVIEVEVHPEEP